MTCAPIRGNEVRKEGRKDITYRGDVVVIHSVTNVSDKTRSYTMMK